MMSLLQLLMCHLHTAALSFVGKQAQTLLANAVVSAKELPELKGDSPRTVAMRTVFYSWMDTISSNSTFAENLLQNIVDYAYGASMQRGRTLSTKFERMWAGYQQLVTSERYMTLWCTALSSIREEMFLPLFIQVITRKLMDEVVQVAFPLREAASEELQQETLKADEEQALRYAAGYVPMKLKKKYMKQTENLTAIKYVNFLIDMHEEDAEVTDLDFLSYTKLWTEKVNRGGLFIINNDTYLLFRAMELSVRQVLNVKKICHQPTVQLAMEMKERIMNDAGVMVHWSCILSKSVMLESEERDNLLQAIAE